MSRSAGTEGSGQRNNKTSLIQLETKYDTLWSAITSTEKDLYSTPNRHKETPEINTKEKALHDAIENYLDHMPRVFDPFAGGGAIPLEAARLGCRTFGNDINPVAHIIQRGSVEFPQKYGKPITFTREAFLKQYPVFAEEPTGNAVAEPNYNYSLNPAIEIEGYDDANSRRNDIKNAAEIRIKNRLAFDVEYYARQMLASAEKEVGYLYPSQNGNTPLAYYWTYVATCSNPGCKAQVPMLRQFYISQRRNANKSEWIYFKPIFEDKMVEFEIKNGATEEKGWYLNKKLNCPFCGNVTTSDELKKQAKNKELKNRLIAVIEESNGKKNIRKPYSSELSIENSINVKNFINEEITKGDSRNLWVTLWGINNWGELFLKRQLIVIKSIINNINEVLLTVDNKEYREALNTYLSFLLDRIIVRYSKHSTWHLKQDTVENIFARQSLPMVFDYPEMNPFSEISSSATSQLARILNYIKSEFSTIAAKCYNATSGEKEQFPHKIIDAVITDPPYYDAIAYADLSDLFYVLLKRTIGELLPINFAYPLTPKSDECTALKHHHDNNEENAKSHFEKKLLKIFSSLEHQTRGTISIMFAHQTTEAWTTLCNSILGANMNITGSWAIDTESTMGLKKNKSYLESSVTVSCKPNIQKGYADFKKIKSKIEERIKTEVRELYASGFRGADLLTACFGKAVSEFGEYQTVEKADGTPVTVSELLELARDAAFNAIISDIDTYDITKFYIGWLNLFGFTPAGHDDVMRITQVGLSVEVADLNHHGIFETSGSKQSLAGYKKRCETNQRLGVQSTSFAIDKIHRALYLFQSGDRSELVKYLGEAAPSSDAPFWRVATAIAEVLPPGCDDHKQLAGLMANKENLVRDAYKSKQEKPEQGKMEL